MGDFLVASGAEISKLRAVQSSANAYHASLKRTAAALTEGSDDNGYSQLPQAGVAADSMESPPKTKKARVTDGEVEELTKLAAPQLVAAQVAASARAQVQLAAAQVKPITLNKKDKGTILAGAGA